MNHNVGLDDVGPGRSPGRAHEVTKGEDVAILDTNAETLFRSGDVEAAIEIEEKAPKRLEEQEKGDRSHPDFKRLERYRKAAKPAA